MKFKCENCKKEWEHEPEDTKCCPFCGHGLRATEFLDSIAKALDSLWFFAFRGKRDFGNLNEVLDEQLHELFEGKTEDIEIAKKRILNKAIGMQFTEPIDDGVFG